MTAQSSQLAARPSHPPRQWRQTRPAAAWPTAGLLAGLAVAGLAWLAWRYVGPDLIRYMKIRNM